MDQVLGTLKDGRIVLDEQPDWPEGQRVWVMPGLDDEPPGTVLPWVCLPDGRRVPINGSPEHDQLLAQQMGEIEPVEMTPEEEARWHSDLKWIGDYTLEAVRKDMGLDQDQD
jgi:hypothetical protein